MMRRPHQMQQAAQSMAMSGCHGPPAAAGGHVGGCYPSGCCRTGCCPAALLLGACIDVPRWPLHRAMATFWLYRLRAKALAKGW